MPPMLQSLSVGANQAPTRGPMARPDFHAPSSTRRFEAFGPPDADGVGSSEVYAGKRLVIPAVHATGRATTTAAVSSHRYKLTVANAFSPAGTAVANTAPGAGRSAATRH